MPGEGEKVAAMSAWQAGHNSPSAVGSHMGHSGTPGSVRRPGAPHVIRGYGPVPAWLAALERQGRATWSGSLPHDADGAPGHCPGGYRPCRGCGWLIAKGAGRWCDLCWAEGYGVRAEHLPPGVLPLPFGWSGQPMATGGYRRQFAQLGRIEAGSAGVLEIEDG